MEKLEKMPKLIRDFWRFHRDNPQVLRDLIRMAEQLRAAGQRHWGMKSLFEVMRWQVALKTQSSDGFRLNNNYTAMYSRLIEKTDPRFVSFFVERQSVADEMFDWPEDR
jgi:hypothetical protein